MILSREIQTILYLIDRWAAMGSSKLPVLSPLGAEAYISIGNVGRPQLPCDQGVLIG